MPVQLKSNQLSVHFNESGAELCSVKNKNGMEYIWQADKEIWARHAPVLFPIVGKLKDDTFVIDDKVYQLGQHGFARDRNFSLIELRDTFCVFELRSDVESKNHFPFDFIFQIQYRLSENTLHTHYRVINPSAQNMYFSVGAHPAFNCPIDSGESFEDYYLLFESNQYELRALNNGLRKEDKMEINFSDDRLPLNKSLFDKDALVFENSQIKKISLASKTSDHQVILECENWPYFGIWSKKGCTQFICLEPWFGIADKETGSGDFFQKEGLIKLEPKKEFNCEFSITFK